MSKTFNPNQLRAYKEHSEDIAVLSHIMTELEHIGDNLTCDYDENVGIVENIFDKAIPAINDTIKIIKAHRKHAFDNSNNDSVYYNGEQEE